MSTKLWPSKKLTASYIEQTQYTASYIEQTELV